MDCKKHFQLDQFLAEFFGTFVLISFGCGSVAMVTLFPSNGHFALAGEVIKGGYINVVLGWGFGLAFAVIVSVRVSGAHLNPAVTIALALTNKFPYQKVIFYSVAQLLGAILGALIVFIVYYAKWTQIDPQLVSTQSIMSTFPAVSGYWPGFIDQIFGTFMLMILILFVSSYFKDPANNIAFPFVIGSIVLVIGICFGGMNGYAINPVRDLGPRIILWIAGFKNNGFSEFRVWSVPIFGPIIGAILGAFIYKIGFDKK